MSTNSNDLDALPAPLRLDETGSIRIGDTRVTLDTIVSFWHQGLSAEGIASKFQTVGLSNIYLTIGHYLDRREVLDRYLSARELEADEHRAKFEPLAAPPGTREVLIERLKKRAAS